MPYSIHKKEKAQIAKMLRSLHFVRWDRFTFDGVQFNFYGWIDKKNHISRKDFIILQFWVDHTYWYWVSSSAEYDKQIAMIIDGSLDETVKCQRVEHNFRIKNSIKLKK